MKKILLLLFIGFIGLTAQTFAQCDATFSYSESSTPGEVFFTPTDTITVYDSYSWSFGDGVSSTSGFPSHIYQSNGIYQVCLSIMMNDSSCTKTYCDSIQVSHADTNTTNPCTDYQVTASDSGCTAISYASNGTAPYTYSWSNGATSSSITAGYGDSLSVTITDANGCKASATATIADSSCTGNQDIYGCMDPNANNYDPNATKSDGSCTYDTTQTCSNYSVTASDSGCTAISYASNGTAPYAYSWSNGAINSSTTANYGDSLSVTITDANGCKASATVTISDSSCTGNQDIYGCMDPNANNYDPNATKSDGSCTYDTTQTCSNYSVTASDSGCTAISYTSNGTAPYAYSWSNGATTSSVTANYGDSLSVTITDAKGCKASATIAISDSSCTGNQDVYGCMDSSALNYNPNATASDGSCHFDNDTIVNLPKDTNVVINDTVSSSVDTCIIDFSLSIDSAMVSGINIIDSVTAEIIWTIYQNNTGHMISVEASIKSNDVILTFLSVSCDTTVNKKSVKLTFSDVVDVKEKTSTGIVNESVFNNINVYPNPVVDQLNLEYSADRRTKVKARLLSTSGQVINEISFNANAGINNQVIETGYLPNGMYILQLTNNEGLFVTKRFVK